MNLIDAVVTKVLSRTTHKFSEDDVTNIVMGVVEVEYQDMGGTGVEKLIVPPGELDSIDVGHKYLH